MDAIYKASCNNACNLQSTCNNECNLHLICVSLQLSCQASQCLRLVDSRSRGLVWPSRWGLGPKMTAHRTPSQIQKSRSVQIGVWQIQKSRSVQLGVWQIQKSRYGQTRVFTDIEVKVNAKTRVFTDIQVRVSANTSVFWDRHIKVIVNTRVITDTEVTVRANIRVLTDTNNFPAKIEIYQTCLY